MIQVNNGNFAVKIRKLLQYRLRTLLIVMSLLSILLGNWTYQGRKQLQATEKIADLRGRYYYWDPSENMKRMLSEDYGKDIFYPSWLRGWVPNEYLADILYVNLAYRRTTDEDLLAIGKLDELKTLELMQTDITGEGLRYLRGCKRLENLYLDNTNITNASLSYLVELPNLKVVSLENCCNISGVGIKHLKEVLSLENLYLVSTEVTQEDIEELQKVLPNCAIVLSSQ